MLPEGNYLGTPTIFSRANSNKDEPTVYVKLVCPEQPAENNSIVWNGPLVGQYADRTRRDLIALGWKGATFATAKGDIEGNGKLVPFRVEHKKYVDKKGDEKVMAVIRGLGYREVPEHVEDSPESLAAIDAALAGDGDMQNSTDPARW